jgi:probable phosphoglycerate mutase
MPLRLYLLRHGQTPSSRDNVFCGAGLDPELTTDGVAMADAFEVAYRATRWSAIYASPLRRTMSTAQRMADAWSLPIQPRPGLVELEYGRWEGLSTDEVRL